MKRKILLCTGLVLIASIIFIVYITFNEKNEFIVPAIENISSIKICPATSGEIKVGEYKELSFDFSKKDDIDLANNILSWLRYGSIMGNAKDEAVSNGSTPTYLKIELKNGTVIVIKSAVSTTYTKGIGVESRNIFGQVTISARGGEEFRVLSPELRSFIENGWKTFFNYYK